MKAELISVGTEILLGEILNTDAQFLSRELSEIGIDVYHQSVVGDNEQRLAESVRTALGRADIVIASGGLGPTPDDITKEVISNVMGKKLVLDSKSLGYIRGYFERIGKTMTKNNEKQAYLPENCIILKNNCGTAPGCIIESGDKAVVILPGPPSELTRMYTESVKPYLKKKSGKKLFTKTLHLFGIGESAVADGLSEYMKNQTNPTLAPYAKTGEVYLRLAAKAQNRDEAEEIMKPMLDIIYGKYGEFVYSDNDMSLPETVVTKLLGKKLTISTAESCTGGLIAKTITDYSGVSEIFSEGYVTYSNNAKMKNLGVLEKTLSSYGAVSEETAREMADGVRELSGADIGVSVTGIAGPGGGTKEKPVGLVYAAVSYGGKTVTKKLMLNGDREKVRYLTMLNAFGMVNDLIGR